MRTLLDEKCGLPFHTFLLLCLLLVSTPAFPKGQDDETGENVPTTEEKSTPTGKTTKKTKEHRKFLTDTPNRSDAGVFHVGAAAGGNVYIEPMYDPDTLTPTGDSFKDFGFQGGVYFDYDYSEVEENIPLMLRGMVGYKYILSSVNVFTFDGVVRRQFRFSEKATFGLGGGASAALWFRNVTSTSPTEEIIFLPSLIVTAGFEFNPIMVDFKWLINQLGSSSSTITGWELYFGVRL
jgi:hypothetical protein